MDCRQARTTESLRRDLSLHIEKRTIVIVSDEPFSRVSVTRLTPAGLLRPAGRLGKSVYAAQPLPAPNILDGYLSSN